MSTFANSEDPDEMQHNAAFHQGLHFFNVEMLTHGSQVSSALTLCIRGKPYMNSFANSEDPDKMQHNAAFHQDLHCSYR